MFIFFLDWSCFEIMTLMCGYIGVTEQATQIILFNVLQVMFQVPYGIQQASCALIGHAIGDENVPLGRRIYKCVMIFTVLADIIEWSLLYYFRKYFCSVFTSEDELLKMFEKTVWIVLIVIAMDFQQGVLCGPIKALGRQHIAAYINFVTYYILTIPLAYFFAFKFRSSINSKGEEVMGLGVEGLWLGFICGMVHQILAYIYLIKTTSWENAVEESRKR